MKQSFKRTGSQSNYHSGNEFEFAAQDFFNSIGLTPEDKVLLYAI